MDKYMRNQVRVKPYKVIIHDTPKRGRAQHTGFTPSDVVSAVLELKLREIGCKPGAMKRAIEHVKAVFVDISGEDVERSIYRDWRQGKNTARALSSEDLIEIIKPHKVTSGK